MGEPDPTEFLPVPEGGGRQLRQGDRLGDRFVIVQFLASGGMGEVYEAIDRHLQDKHIALKTLRAEIAGDAEMRARFERDVLLAREVNHRNVCPTYDLFRLEGPRGAVLCLTMKLLRGESLAARLRRLGPMPPEVALPIVRQMAEGLDAAHAAGVIHRDFKPGNVILEHPGQNPQVSITDFGLSRPYDSDHTLGIGKVAGTRGYIAPELFEGRSASPASDVYAFGVVLHEILTGRQPVTKPGSRDFVKPSGLGQDIPDIWDRIILGCLASDPSQRFQSAGEPMALLKSQSKGDRPAAAPPSRRRWLWIAGGGALAGALFIGGPRLDRLLHPLPQRRFVLLMAKAARRDPADIALLDNVVDSISIRLVRAESYVKDLLIIGPRDLAGQQKPKKPEDAIAAFGANLVLTVSLSGSAEALTLELLDPAFQRVLRHASLRIKRAGLARIPEEAATAAARLLGLPQIPQVWRDQDELAGLSASVYQLFSDAEELRRQPNDTGLDQALEKYQQALDGEPHFALGYARIALAYMRKHQLTHDRGALAMAEKNAQLAIAHNPESPNAVLSQALVYLYSGRTGPALDWLAKALKLDPGNPEVLLYEAAAYRDLNRPADEQDTYRLIVKQRPNFYMAYNELGFSLYRQSRYAESVTVFQQATQVAPRQALPLTNLGVVYQLLGRNQDAVAAFRASLDRAPSELAYLSLGNLLFEEGDYRKALESYTKARDLTPSDDFVWRNIGDCHAVLGNRKGMLENYASAAKVLSDQLQTNSNDGPGWMTLAFYEAKLGHRADSETDIGTAETKGATDVESQFTKAQTLAVLGRKAEAIDVLVACVRQGLSPVEVKLALDLKKVCSDPRYLKQISNLQHLPTNSEPDKERSK